MMGRGAPHHRFMSEDEKRLTAYREGRPCDRGAARAGGRSGAQGKRSFRRRVAAWGMVKQLPENDQISVTLEQMTGAARRHDGRAGRRGDGVRPEKRSPPGLPPTSRRHRSWRATMVGALGALRRGRNGPPIEENQEEVFPGPLRGRVSSTTSRKKNRGKRLQSRCASSSMPAFAEANGILTAHRDQLETVATGPAQIRVA